MALGGGLRPEETPDDIARFRIRRAGGDDFGSTWHWTWRRERYRGEHPSNFWSRTQGSESPRLGYAPRESRTKRWAIRVPHRRIVPIIGVENDTATKSPGSPEKRREIRHDNPSHEMLPHHLVYTSSSQNGRDRKAESGSGRWVQEPGIERMGRICLDTQPYRRNFELRFRSWPSQGYLIRAL